MTDDDYTRRAIEHVMQTLSGMPREDTAKLDAFNAAQTDWFGFCQKCGTKISGSMRELSQHRC